MTTKTLLAEHLWDGEWRHGVQLVVSADAVFPVAHPVGDPATLEPLRGWVFPPFTDFHVHLDLVDALAVDRGGLARVLDLGGNRQRTWPVGRVEVARAGEILTAVGGYPSTRPWASDAMFREVDPRQVDLAIRNQVNAGAHVIKIAINSDAGPVWPDDLLADVVRTAHAWAKPVVAHVEGAGQAERAAEAGVDVFAHVPFTETLSDDVIHRIAPAIAWISTLRIHEGADQERAVHNATRFVAAGGRVLYGTDMGNGAASGRLQPDELHLLGEVGLRGDGIVAGMTGGRLLTRWGAAVMIADAPDQLIDAQATWWV